MRINILTGLLLVSVVYGVQGQHLNLYGNLQFGPHQVGTSNLSHRYYDNGKPRDLNITTWYPALAKGKALTFGGYLTTGTGNSEAQQLKDLSVAIGGEEKLFSEDTLTAILNFPVKASREALPTPQPFPLVIWSMRYETVAHQSIISEFLASHGYIVAFAEDIPHAPYPWALQSADEKNTIVNQQVKDINAAIQFLKQQRNVNPTKIGLMAWSYAGESAVLTQMKNPEIDLVIGLSGISLSSGIYLGQGLASLIDIEKLITPYLILSEKIGTNGKERKPPAQLKSMHPQSKYISFTSMTHGNFNALEGMLPGILRTNKVQSWSKGGQEAQQGYEAVCQMTLSFLDSNFSDKSNMTFNGNLQALQSQLPNGFFTIYSSAEN